MNYDMYWLDERTPSSIDMHRADGSLRLAMPPVRRMQAHQWALVAGSHALLLLSAGPSYPGLAWLQAVVVAGLVIAFAFDQLVRRNITFSRTGLIAQDLLGPIPVSRQVRASARQVAAVRDRHGAVARHVTLKLRDGRLVRLAELGRCESESTATWIRTVAECWRTAARACGDRGH